MNSGKSVAISSLQVADGLGPGMGSGLLEFYRHLGHGVHLSAGVCWVTQGRFTLTPLPTVLPCDPSGRALQELLRASGRWLASYTTAEPTGRRVDAFCVSDPSYGMNHLQRQFRQQVRRAQAVGEVRTVPWDVLVWEAGPIHADTLRRRGGRIGPQRSVRCWEAACAAASQDPRIEAFGCYVGPRLASYMVVWSGGGGICHGLQMLWSEEYKEHHPTHLLYYEVTRELMRRPGVRVLSVGRQVIPPMAKVDFFKRHAGFQPVPCHVAMIGRPLLNWLARSAWIRGGFSRVRAGSTTGRRWLGMSEVLDVMAESRESRR